MGLLAMQLRRNMGPFDQVLRTGIGVGLIWFGFFDNWFITDRVVGALLGIFGIVNLFFAPISFCPIYHLAGISTRSHDETHTRGASANLRKRLLAATIGLSVVVLGIFGIVSFRIAEDASTQHAPSVLVGMAGRLSASLARTPAARLQDRLRAASAEHRYLRLDSPDGRPLYANPDDTLQARFWSALAQARSQKTSSFEFDGERYFWTDALLPDSGQRLTLVEPSPRIAQPVVESLALKLGVMGFIVVWIAVWAALVIASTMGRRLDEQNAALIHQAQHDDLTGLPNRSLLRDRLDHALRLAVRERHPLALLIMDLDRFKEVNDTLGHSYGDALLKQVAVRLADTLRASDTCARLGGDEFAVLLPNTSAGGATVCTQKIHQALDQAFVINGVALRLRTSVGIAVYPEHGEDTDALIRRADVAMYNAKRRRSGFALYMPESDPNSLERLTLANDLRAGIEHGQLELHYQPKLCLKSWRVIGVEALVRWRHPRLGQIPPDKFIYLAEQNGLIQDLTEWVLREAIATAAKWSGQGLPVNVAVNLSPLNLLDADLPSRIAGWLQEAGVPPDRLELELTETAAMADVARAAAIFEQLSAMGIRIAIDDFGTGMSSLSYLRRLPVNDIKIDRSFVTDMLRDEHNAVLVRSIIDLSHNLGRRVIAEGIEDSETLSQLEVLGCDSAQGYFISRPLPAAQIEQFLQAESMYTRNPRVVASGSVTAKLQPRPAM